MTNLLRLKNVLIGAALLVAPAACHKDENKTAKAADNAAERVNDNVKDLRDESKDVVETARDMRGDLNDKAGDKAEDTIDDVNDLKKDIHDRVASDTARDKDVDETVDESHEVAENARDNREDVREKAADSAKAVIDEQRDVAEQAMDVKHAQFDFGYARLTRVGTLRAIYGVAQAQPQLINAFAHDVELNAPERSLINEKLSILNTRLDEAGNQIESLAKVPAETWEQRHDDANKAMDRLEEARDDAWDALHAAQRASARTSMR